ncbi:MAG TPA: hypothetical protein VGK73_17415 [Polyangiaceae bacterium]
MVQLAALPVVSNPNRKGSEPAIHVLVIELPELPEAERAALAFSRDEQLAWLKAAARRSASLVVLVGERSLELYSLESERERAFRAVLESLRGRVKDVPAFAKVRTVAKRGIVAARHLVQRAGGADEVPRLMTQLHAATALSAYSAALGMEVGALFRAAVAVSRRIRKETALGDPNAPQALREIERLAADRIVEEELAAWQAQAAEAPRGQEQAAFDEPVTRAGVARSNRPELLSSVMNGIRVFAEEPGSMVRVRIGTALASSSD